jgi:hypothetical protein
MDKHTSSENISSWIRAASAAIGVLLLSVFVMSNSENEKSSTLTKETKTKEMRNLENLSPDQAESEEKLTKETKTKEMRNLENLSPDQAESEEKLTVEIQKVQYRH